MKKYLVFLICLTTLLCCGCSGKKTDDGPDTPVEFTVVDFSSIPGEIQTVIEEKKAEPFQMSANIEGYTYIVIGYGRQETGGYSIKVDFLTQNDKCIKVQTTLIGPSKNEAVNRLESYPVIVMKFEQIDKMVEYL